MKRMTDKDYESVNAREWEENSTIGDPLEVRAQSQAGNTVTTVVTTAATLRGSPAHLPSSSTQIQRSRPMVANNITRNVKRDTTAARPAAISTKKTGWAEPPAIEKTRQRKNKEMKEEQLKRDQRFLGQPNTQEEAPGTGFYIWPKNLGRTEEGNNDNSSNHPRDMFGAKLEKLDLLRKVHRVFIEWDGEIKCLKVSSESKFNSESAIAATMNGIRQAVHNANAQMYHASPLYVIVPPRGHMKSNVMVKSSEDGRSGAAIPIITGFQLSGKSFSKEEQELWASTLGERQQKNIELFRGHLVNHILRLGPLRSRMRMRVHFGHVNVVSYNKKKIESADFNFASMEEMMGHSRTMSRFDRRLDGNFATRLMKEIVGDPETFCPKDARVFNLRDVAPKHTMVMFLSYKDVHMRVESAIDHAPGFEESSGWEKGKHAATYFKPGSYQMGTTDFYYDTKRNKRAEVTTLDIQKGFDWTMEIIEDGKVPDIPSELLDLVKTCVTSATKDRVDSLGLPYPGITPRQWPNLGIGGIHVRSIYEYVFTESQFVIEIAIYRSWQGCEVVGQSPEIQTSVSLYHRVWDEETASIENTTYERCWDRDLKCFFEQKDQIGGIEGFLDHVAFILDMLVAAEKRGLHGPSAGEPAPAQ